MIPAAVERAVAASKADGCIVIASEATEADIRWANTTTTTNGVRRSVRLTVISVVGGRVGTVSRTSVDDVEDAVRASEAACEGNPEAPDVCPLVEGGVDSAFDEPHPPTGIEVFGAFAQRLGGVFDRARSDDLALFGYAEHSLTTVWLATSSGVRRRHSQPSGVIELNAKTPDFGRSTWAGRNGAAPDDVDPDAMYGEVTERLGWASERVELPAGRYEVLLTPSCVADMLFLAYGAATARDADEGRSVFAAAGGNLIGERIAADAVSLYSDPAEHGLEVRPFVVAGASSSQASVFDNGLDTDRTDWIADGVLRRLITPRWWAQRAGGEAAPQISNLVMPSDGPSLDEMVASTQRALLVNCLWYIRTVDPKTLLVTGLTRDGVYLVEDGEVRGAVNNFRFNESPVGMLERVTQLGATETTLAREFGDYFRSTKMPPLRIEGFNMSSVSQAT